MEPTSTAIRIKETKLKLAIIEKFRKKKVESLRLEGLGLRHREETLSACIYTDFPNVYITDLEYDRTVEIHCLDFQKRKKRKTRFGAFLGDLTTKVQLAIKSWTYTWVGAVG